MLPMGQLKQSVTISGPESMVKNSLQREGYPLTDLCSSIFDDFRGKQIQSSKDILFVILVKYAPRTALRHALDGQVVKFRKKRYARMGHSLVQLIRTA